MCVGSLRQIRTMKGKARGYYTLSLVFWLELLHSPRLGGV